MTILSERCRAEVNLIKHNIDGQINVLGLYAKCQMTRDVTSDLQ